MICLLILTGPTAFGVNEVKLVPMVLTLIDQDVLDDYELVVRFLAIDHLLGRRPLMVQRAE